MARILVAEDDKSANKLICAVLRKDGHETLSAADGREALDVLDREHIDLIVSDVMMPRVGGMELVSQLRGAQWDTPVLMLTARTDAETLHAGFLSGADDYLTSLRGRPSSTPRGTPSSAQARGSSCRPRSSSCCSGCCPARGAPSRACSCWTRCGAGTPTARRPR